MAYIQLTHSDQRGTRLPLGARLAVVMGVSAAAWAGLFRLIGVI